jgi:hypothetical protein
MATGAYPTIWKTQLSSNSSTCLDPLGALRIEQDTTNGGFLRYRYVQVNADTTVANGTVLTYTDLYHTDVTSDISDTGQNAVAGVGIGAITASYYGWIQTGGYHSAVRTNANDDIAKYDMLIADATVDGTCDSVAGGTAPTHRVLGYAVAADVDASDTVAAQLTIDS